MKGNEALAEAALRAGMKAYFGYPITPQSEVLEYLTLHAREHAGTVVLQAESEIAAVHMVFGAAGAGARVMISSSSPGISLMQEGFSYMACSQLPALVVNVQRGGPGLGTIQPAQGDYHQAVRGGGHGDYRLIVLAPSSVQELVDHVFLGFQLAERYRTPAMILADGALGQMMEKVTLPPAGSLPHAVPGWATTGKPKERARNVIHSVFIEPERMERQNLLLQEKYRKIREAEPRCEQLGMEDAEIALVAFGLSARICQKAMDLGREQGIRVGLLRPITLFPFPTLAVARAAASAQAFLTVELNAGQMVEDVRLAVNGRRPVEFVGRMGGMVPSPDDVLARIEEMAARLRSRSRAGT
ncbi:MAG TPA: 3-methyl-2-oxobutanoate dehydrogenase subunit VorB [Anaeromyxobacteraceae bacterium]|nr:3-methyl-2-oxobutanoate dehydrogenase subunit VorB [Anaeromyxobacteraceae bacterium]